MREKTISTLKVSTGRSQPLRLLTRGCRSLTKIISALVNLEYRFRTCELWRFINHRVPARRDHYSDTMDAPTNIFLVGELFSHTAGTAIPCLVTFLVDAPMAKLFLVSGIARLTPLSLRKPSLRHNTISVI